MEDIMETLTNIALVIVIGYVFAEICAGVYIYRNRRTVLPRISYTLRSLLGLTLDESANHDRFVMTAEKINRIERKLNYIGRHVNFEREQLRKMGILKDQVKTERQITQDSQPNNTLPFRRS
jgi:hypothetical protein